MENTQRFLGDKTQEDRINDLMSKINQSTNQEETKSFIDEIRNIQNTISSKVGEQVGYRKGRISTIEVEEFI